MSKTATASFKYGGSLEDLERASLDACRQMSLKVKSHSKDGEGFLSEAAEKMKWLTTNWPVSLSIQSRRSGDDLAVVITAGTTLFSITQDFNNQHKAQELSSLIQSLAPTPNTRESGSSAVPESDFG